jgi:hypothetical protein
MAIPPQGCPTIHPGVVAEERIARPRSANPRNRGAKHARSRHTTIEPHVSPRGTLQHPAICERGVCSLRRLRVWSPPTPFGLAGVGGGRGWLRRDGRRPAVTQDGVGPGSCRSPQAWSRRDYARSANWTVCRGRLGPWGRARCSSVQPYVGACSDGDASTRYCLRLGRSRRATTRLLRVWVSCRVTPCLHETFRLFKPTQPMPCPPAGAVRRRCGLS